MSLAIRRIMACIVLAILIPSSSAYHVTFDDVADSQEICSGMYGGQHAQISLAFDQRSTGQVAIAWYEWSDVDYLGSNVQRSRNHGPRRTYICTTSAVERKFCLEESLGTFITSLPEDVQFSDTTLMISSLYFDGEGGSPDDDPDEELVYETPDDFNPEGQEAGTYLGTDEPGQSELIDGLNPDQEQEEQAQADENDEQQAAADQEEQTDGSILDYQDNAVVPSSNKGSTPHKPEAISGVASDDPQVDEQEAVAGVYLNNDETDEQEDANEDGDSNPGYQGNQATVMGPQDPRPVIDAEPSVDMWRARSRLQRLATRSSKTSSQFKSTHRRLARDLRRPGKRALAAKRMPASSRSEELIYQVPRSGYYCVAIIPVTMSGIKRDVSSSKYSGRLSFRNQFEGELRAVDYPRMQLFTSMMVVYGLIAGSWSYLCYKYSPRIHTIQWAITGILAVLVLEYSMLQGYYRYLNAHDSPKGSVAWLITVALLNATRNTASLSLLLVVCMGWGIYRTDIDSELPRLKVLAGLHYAFGAAHAITSICMDVETTSVPVVVFLLVPSTISLCAFLAWTLLSLKTSRMHLARRQQSVKLAIIERLNKVVLSSTIVTVVAFAYSSSIVYSNSGDSFPARTWRYRWLILDGLPSAIYFVTIGYIIWLLRPTENSYRLAMSEQVPQGIDSGHDDDYEADLELDKYNYKEPIL